MGYVLMTGTKKAICFSLPVTAGNAAEEVNSANSTRLSGTV